LSASLVIAVVDDDPDVRDSLDSLMRSVGWTSVGFAGGDELLEAGAQSGFACIVTDLHMPGMTGLELQAEIVRRGWTQPVILMTAYPTDAARAQAMAAGAVAFLTKPIDPDSLIEAVAAAA
jgi:FixJ family two-component response regulator